MTISGTVVGGVVEPVLSFPWESEVDYSYQLQMSTDLKTFEDILLKGKGEGKGARQIVLTLAFSSYETGALSPVSSMIFPGRAREVGC